MITWRDTICIICEVFSINQQQLATCLNVHESALSRIKNGVKKASFDNNAIFNNVFNPETEKSPAHDLVNDKKILLSSLKDTIEYNFPEAREALSDCWEEDDYKQFVLNLLLQTKNVPTSGKTKLRGDCDKPISETGINGNKAADQATSAASFDGARLHIEGKYKCCRFCSKWQGVDADEVAMCKIFKGQRTATGGKDCTYYKPAEGRITIETIRCRLS